MDVLLFVLVFLGFGIFGHCHYVNHNRLTRLSLPEFHENETDLIKFVLELDKKYTVRLKPTRTPWTPWSRFVLLEDGGRRIRSDEPASKFTRRFYIGRVLEDTKATVVGTFVDGVFDGVLELDDKVLYVEPDSRTPGFNAIAYWFNDVGDGNSSSVIEVGQPRWFPVPNQDRKLVKRSAPKVESLVHICNLSVVVDHLFYKHYAGSSVDQVFREVETNVFYADSYFRNADFDEDEHRDAYGFRVNKIFVVQSPSLLKEYVSNKADVYYSWRPRALFREMFANLEHFKENCAGLFFTYRLSGEDESDGITQVKVDFSRDVQRRGFCSKPVESGFPPRDPIDDYTPFLTNTMPVNFYYKGGKASTALGIASSIHQLGHLFHASDDSESCRSTSGHFFMDLPIKEIKAKSTARFSDCSLRAIDAAIRNKKKTDVYCVFGCAIRSDGDCKASDLVGGTAVVPLTTMPGHEPAKKFSGDYYGGGGMSARSSDCFIVAVLATIVGVLRIL